MGIVSGRLEARCLMQWAPKGYRNAELRSFGESFNNEGTATGTRAGSQQRIRHDVSDPSSADPGCFCSRGAWTKSSSITVRVQIRPPKAPSRRNCPHTQAEATLRGRIWAEPRRGQKGNRQSEGKIALEFPYDFIATNSLDCDLQLDGIA
jgi:hypothetical protein